MKLGLLVVVLCFSVNAFGMTREEALAVFSSEEIAMEVFAFTSKRTEGLELSYFTNKSLTVVSTKDESQGFVLTIKENTITIGEQSAPLLIEGNIINLDLDSEVCRTACLILPKVLKSFDGYIPGVMMTVVSYFGPGVPQYSPVLIKVESF